MVAHKLGPGRAVQTSFQRPTKGFVALTVSYVVVNVLIFVFKDPSIGLKYAADGVSWFAPALAMLNADIPFPHEQDFLIYRGPGIPAFFALMMYLAGGVSIPAIVIGQIIVLYLTGVIVRAMVKDWFPDYATAAMGLMLFNPNLLAKAYFVQSEIFGTFSFAVVLWLILRYAKGDFSWKNIIALGLALGLACLVRTNPVYFIYMLPLALPMISRVQGHSISTPRAYAKGLVAMCLAVLVIAPWALKIYDRTGMIGWSLLISPRAEQEYVFDELVVLEGTLHYLNRREAIVQLKQPDRPIEQFIRSFGSNWQNFSDNERHALLKGFETKLLFDYSPGIWLKTFAISQGQFFFGAGSGSWHNLFGAYAGGLSTLSFTPFRDLPLLRRIVTQAPPLALALSVVCFLFVLVTRLALVLGTYEFSRRKMWGPLLILWGVILYVAFSTLFQGHARYRTSVEPHS